MARIAVKLAGRRSLDDPTEIHHRHVIRKMLDDRQKGYSEASALLDRHPDLAAIYNVGAGNTGIARALKERGRAQSMVFLGHEVTDGTKDLLLDGTLDAVASDLRSSERRSNAVAVRVIWTGDHLDAARRLQGSLLAPAQAARARWTAGPLRRFRLLEPLAAARACRAGA